MSAGQDEFSSFSALLRSAIGDLLAPDAETFLEMFAEDGVMEFPFAPEGGVRRLDGRSALAGYLPSVAKMVEIDRMTEPTVHRTLDPAVVILEFACSGRGVATGLPYDQRYVSVITVRGGRIVRYLDYWNPLAVLRAVGGEQAMTTALRGGGDDAA